MQHLRKLRRLHFNHAKAAAQLAHVQALAATLPEPPDLSVLVAAEAHARAAYGAHAALNPALAAEYADRVELADTLTALQRATRALDALTHRPPADPGEPPADDTTPALIHAAGALDAEHRAAVAETEPNWHAIHQIETRAAVLRDRIHVAERQHEARMARHAAAVTARKRHAAEVQMMQTDINRLRAYADTLRQRLPATVAAPLREPRRTYRAPPPAHLLPAIRARYDYDPTTDTLRRKPAGTVVRAPQSLKIDGHRIPRAAIVAALFDPASLA